MSLSSLFIIVLTTYIFLFLGVLICLTRVYFLAVFFSKDLRTHTKVIKLAGCAGSLSPGWRWGGGTYSPRYSTFTRSTFQAPGSSRVSKSS